MLVLSTNKITILLLKVLRKLEGIFCMEQMVLFHIQLNIIQSLMTILMNFLLGLKGFPMIQEDNIINHYIFLSFVYINLIISITIRNYYSLLFRLNRLKTIHFLLKNMDLGVKIIYTPVLHLN